MQKILKNLIVKIFLEHLKINLYTLNKLCGGDSVHNVAIFNDNHIVKLHITLLQNF